MNISTGPAFYVYFSACSIGPAFRACRDRAAKTYCRRLGRQVVLFKLKNSFWGYFFVVLVFWDSRVQACQDPAVAVFAINILYILSRRQRHLLSVLALPFIEASQAQATSYSIGCLCFRCQLYMQRSHKQPVVKAAQAQAISYITGCFGL